MAGFLGGGATIARTPSYSKPPPVTWYLVGLFVHEPPALVVDPQYTHRDGPASITWYRVGLLPHEPPAFVVEPQ